MNIRSLSQLNAAIKDCKAFDGKCKKVGFLTEGNFQSVENELEKSVEPIYIYKNATALTQAVANGDILAGLVSGTPTDSGDLNIFSSEQVSVRAMLQAGAGAETITKALDAAIVRFIERGGVETVAAANPPYQALVVHSCKPTASHFNWPTEAQLKLASGVQSGGKLKIASLGPYDWGGADGNYKVSPFVGFWPDYYNELEKEFLKQYNIGFERVWFKTSSAVMAAVQDGTCHTTEPYMMLGSAASTDTSRKTAFDETCITSATIDKYFTKLAVPELPVTVPPQDLTALWVVLAVAAIFAFFCSVFSCVLLCRERAGSPLFTPLVTDGKNDVVTKQKTVNSKKTMEMA